VLVFQISIEAESALITLPRNPSTALRITAVKLPNFIG